MNTPNPYPQEDKEPRKLELNSAILSFTNKPILIQNLGTGNYDVIATYQEVIVRCLLHDQPYEMPDTNAKLHRAELGFNLIQFNNLFSFNTEDINMLKQRVGIFSPEIVLRTVQFLDQQIEHMHEKV